MTVVSDASPLIGLAAVGRLDLLRQLLGAVSIPTTVHEEVVRATGRAGAEELAASDWVVVRKPDNDFLVRALAGELDRGEAEAIALAVELNADLVLLDRVEPLLSDLLHKAGFRLSAELCRRVLEEAGEAST